MGSPGWNREGSVAPSKPAERGCFSETANRSLHRARLSPKRVVSTLVTRTGEPRPPLHDLVTAIRDVLKLAIRNQYRTGAEDPFLVYDHGGERCPRRGCGGTIRRIVQGGRSTFYCPGCQR